MTLDRFGMENSAFSFDGQSNFLSTDIENRVGDFSISLWAKAHNTQKAVTALLSTFMITPQVKGYLPDSH